LIIGRNRYYSFTDQGHIRKWEREFGKGPEIILKTLGEGLVESKQRAGWLLGAFGCEMWDFGFRIWDCEFRIARPETRPKGGSPKDNCGFEKA
jgi:hypothetical protein